MQSWCSHKLPIIDCHSEGTKISNKVKLRDPPPNQSRFTSVSSQDVTHILPVFSWHRCEASYLQTRSSLGFPHSGVPVWTDGRLALTDDEAYLLTALPAWADPACRSFCRSHRFFSLSGAERREDDVSHVFRDDSLVRPTWFSRLQIAQIQCL